jgi:hypothetical protein
MKNQEERQPGFGVNAEFLTALSDLVIDNGHLWGLEDRDGTYILMKGKSDNRAIETIETVREVEVPKPLGLILSRLVKNEGRRVRNRIREALAIAPER